jgi:gamma-butyrobetaine dioxygenase
VTEALAFPADWLRYHCPCPDCRDPVTGQRLLSITNVPNDLVVTVTAHTSAEIGVTFAPDGHRSVFRRDWLAERARDEEDPRTEDAKRLWRAADLAKPPATDWDTYLCDDAIRAEILDAVARFGVALLYGVPASAGMVLEVAATFGYVRETNYGRLFDVRVEPDPDNLAFTSRAIAPHTDNPYRDPVPTLQLLHCLRDAASDPNTGDASTGGGDTGLVDGFAAAAALRATDPESFGVLTGTPVTFGYIDKGTQLSARQPLISLSPRGRITGVRYNERSMQAPAAEPFYAALRGWARLLARPEFRLRLRLSPGDCLIFDNTRILHARTAFSAPVSSNTGERHLQGCYADLDGLLSALAVLRRGQ